MMREYGRPTPSFHGNGPSLGRRPGLVLGRAAVLAALVCRSIFLVRRVWGQPQGADGADGEVAT